jgi:excinuclease ABC subunit C
LKRNSTIDTLHDRAKELPEEPGVYLFKDSEDKVIYVGKAIALKRRVTSYFRDRHKDPKARAITSRAATIEIIVTENEMEALLLENSLIKEHRPRFNVRLKDDKQYPYIGVTLGEKYPRVIYTRTIRENGTKYFGPYTDARAARQTVDMVNKLFRLRTCRKPLPLKEDERPCVNYQIDRCIGPCKEYISREEYLQLAYNAVAFLEGSTGPVIRSLQERMMDYSTKLEYEKAGAIKSIIDDIHALHQDQNVAMAVGDDIDYIISGSLNEETLILLFEFRGGSLLGRKISVMENREKEPEKEAVRLFLVDYYSRNEIPSRIITPYNLKDRKIIEEMLSSKSSHRVIITSPGSDTDRSVIKLMEKNIHVHITERSIRATEQDPQGALDELQELLNLSSPPETVVCFDISNIQGTYAVASMVTFTGGMPDKKNYRRFKIRGYEGANDPGMIHEAVARRIQFLLNEDLPLPGCMVIDGGPTQLTRAMEAAETLDADVTIISLAKKHEEVFYHPKKPPIILSAASPARKLLQRIRDESHRFAITYHRSLRDRAMLRSQLDEIPGLGKEMQKRLLGAFGHVDAIRRASLEELEEVPGIGKKTAAVVFHFFTSKPD